MEQIGAQTIHTWHIVVCQQSSHSFSPQITIFRALPASTILMILMPKRIGRGNMWELDPSGNCTQIRQRIFNTGTMPS